MKITKKFILGLTAAKLAKRGHTPALITHAPHEALWEISAKNLKTLVASYGESEKKPTGYY